MDNQNGSSEIEKLKLQLQSADLPANLREKANHQIDRIALTLKYGGNLSQIDITAKYIDWIANLPWNKKTEDTLDLVRAKAVLDKNHFGLEKIKQRLIEYISILITQRGSPDGAPSQGVPHGPPPQEVPHGPPPQEVPHGTSHAPQLFFVGLVGTGKTTLAQSFAEALGRNFVRIPFGGLSSALDLRGQSKTSPESEPGMLIRAIRRAKVKNPVILLDELDRITPESRASIMGVLVELLDPEQNSNFFDYFVDYPFDLSQVLFIATANNTNNISTAVMDRLEVIQMPSYTDEEKMMIGKNFVFPHYLKNVGLTPDNIKIDDNVWPLLIRPLGYDSGIRSLERTIEGIVRKVAYKIVNKQGTSFVISEANLKEYLA